MMGRWQTMWVCKACHHIFTSILFLTDDFGCSRCGEGSNSIDKTTGKWVEEVVYLPRRFWWPKRVIRRYIMLHADYKEAMAIPARRHSL